METLEFNVDASANNIRIDRYLADQCPEHSRSYIQKLLKEEQVLVNGRVIKANYKTQSGDYIEFHIPDPEVLDILPENIPLDILYEDDGRTSQCRTYFRHTCQCRYGTLWRTFIRY